MTPISTWTVRARVRARVRVRVKVRVGVRVRVRRGLHLVLRGDAVLLWHHAGAS